MMLSTVRTRTSVGDQAETVRHGQTDAGEDAAAFGSVKFHDFSVAPAPGVHNRGST
jgi:hypothetical protein